MKVHLITVVGGHHVQLLDQTLQHYHNLGISSFLVHANLRNPEDTALNDLQFIANKFGFGIASVSYGDHAAAQRAAWKSRQRFPDDWYLIVDADEFQVFPAPLVDILENCERKGYDHVKGCFLDRVASDGILRKLSPQQAIWTQYPVGLFLTYPLLRGDPRKVVAAKGHVEMSSHGHHNAISERGCPITEYFIPVHHFKWVEGVIEALEHRIHSIRSTSPSDHWRESQRFIDYYKKNGKIDINNPSWMAGLCSPDYPHWERIRDLFLQLGFH